MLFPKDDNGDTLEILKRGMAIGRLEPLFGSRYEAAKFVDALIQLETRGHSFAAIIGEAYMLLSAGITKDDILQRIIPALGEYPAYLPGAPSRHDIVMMIIREDTRKGLSATALNDIMSKL
ncbi:MAG: hypothetical protein ACYC6A_24215 [Armatimonadota bacterium]